MCYLYRLSSTCIFIKTNNIYIMVIRNNRLEMGKNS